jgi:hypothetical protein
MEHLFQVLLAEGGDFVAQLRQTGFYRFHDYL